MVDLHCHILPGLDDGPATLGAALDLARAEKAQGVDTVVATPHVREDYPFRIELIDERLASLRMALREADIGLELVSGAEVDLVKATELDDDTLARLCLGSGRYLLVESPYSQAPSLLETALYDLQLRGFRPVLAHPERSSTFLRDRPRLDVLVERGILCSVTAMSLTGAFGRAIRDFTLGLFVGGLVHNVASDAHDAARRAPRFDEAAAALEGALQLDADSVAWFTETAGRTIIEGGDVTTPPPSPSRRLSWRRLKDRVGVRPVS